MVITIFDRVALAVDNEETFRSSSQAVICPSVYHTRWRRHTVPLIAKRQPGNP